MDISEAKKVSIVDYLSGKGFNQSYPNWYCSPLRNENEPSFHVTEEKIWYDHGIGKGGNILDLVMILDNVDLSGAIKILARVEHSDPVVLANISYPKHDHVVIIDQVNDLMHPQLLSYLDDRGIPWTTAQKYCKQLSYHIGDNKYYAIGFKNQSEGWELRNKFFKGGSSPKDITVIKGNHTLILFEGFFDFLSFMTLYPMAHDCTFIILNSLALLERAFPFIKKSVKTITLFDNDPAGKEACEKLSYEFHIVNMEHLNSTIYPNHKDFNDYLIHRND
jgi:hypothetical protein